jgi:glutaryl-CoA dehydrogenase
MQKAFNRSNVYLLVSQLNEDEKMVRDAARAFAQAQLQPTATENLFVELTDSEVFRKMGAQDLLGITIPEQNNTDPEPTDSNSPIEWREQ